MTATTAVWAGCASTELARVARSYINLDSWRGDQYDGIGKVRMVLGWWGKEGSDLGGAECGRKDLGGDEGREGGGEEGA